MRATWYKLLPMHQKFLKWTFSPDRQLYFYTASRWLAILVLTILLPLFGAAEGVAVANAAAQSLLWLYVGFSIVASISLFIPQARRLLDHSSAADIFFISMFALLAKNFSDIFFGLYLLPLVGYSLRHRPANTLLLGMLAALCYAAIFLPGTKALMPNNGPPVAAITILLQLLTLALVPWLTSGLAERGSEGYRDRITAAQRQTDEALRAAEVSRDKIRLIYGVASMLAGLTNHQEILDAVLYECRKMAPYRAATVLLASGKRNELVVSAELPAAPNMHLRPVKVTGGKLQDMLQSSSTPLQIANIQFERDVASLSIFQGCEIAYMIPLRVGIQSYGILIIANEGNTPFTQEQMDLFTTLANYAIVALHNAQLRYDLARDRVHLLDAEERARHQLARDIHDGLAQTLAAMTMNLDVIRRMMDVAPDQVPTELDRVGSMFRQAHQEVRTLLFELRPLALESQGLAATLEQYIERLYSHDPGTRFALEATGVIGMKFPRHVEVAIFNIIQESVNNARKHARANQITIRVKHTNDLLNIIIEDDGRGFDKEKLMESYEDRGSFGLINIEERARLIDGTAEIQSEVGKGTRVYVNIPISPL